MRHCDTEVTRRGEERVACQRWVTDSVPRVQRGLELEVSCATHFFHSSIILSLTGCCWDSKQQMTRTSSPGPLPPHLIVHFSRLRLSFATDMQMARLSVILSIYLQQYSLIHKFTAPSIAETLDRQTAAILHLRTLYIFPESWSMRQIWFSHS